MDFHSKSPKLLKIRAVILRFCNVPAKSPFWKICNFSKYPKTEKNHLAGILEGYNFFFA